MTAIRSIICFLLAALCAPGQSSGTAAADLLAAARRASFTQTRTAGPLRVSVLELALAAPAARALALGVSELEPPDKKVLAQLLRLEILEDAHVFGRLLPAGRYVIGLGSRAGLPYWLLRDRDGMVRALRPYQARPSDEPVVLELHDDDFGVAVDLVAGDQNLGFRVIPDRRLERTLGREIDVVEGRVRLKGRGIEPTIMKAIAAELDRGLALQAALIGPALGDDDLFTIHLVSDGDRWLELEASFGQGELEASYGFMAEETGRAYCDASILVRRGSPPADLVPIILRHTLHHELNHLLVSRLRPESEALWPTWLSEGLADLAAARALRAEAPALAAFHEGLVRASMRAAIDIGSWPEPTDLIGERADSDPVAWYGVAASLVEALDGEGAGGLASVLDALVDAPDRRRAGARLLEVLQRRFGGPAAALAQIRAGGVELASGPSVSAGYVDPEGDAYRVTADHDGALLVLPTRHSRDDRFVIEGEFAWVGPTASPIAIEMALHQGRHAIRCLCLVVGPTELRLESWTETDREQLATRTLDPALPRGQEGEPTWHRLRLEFQREGAELQVTIDGDLRATFTLDSYVPILGGRIGFGLDQGSALFKLPRILP